MFGRTGFYIHNMGLLGSDGCIVPVDPKHLWTIGKALGTGLSGRIAPYLQKPGTLWVHDQFLPIEVPDHVRRIVERTA